MATSEMVVAGQIPITCQLCEAGGKIHWKWTVATPEVSHNIAPELENEDNTLLLDGKFYLQTGQYGKAMKQFLGCNGEDRQSIELAIETVVKANDDHLTAQLVAFLTGKTDNRPKDSKYMFRLYMTLKQYEKAITIAMAIASERQKEGEYKITHDMLFSMIQELKQEKVKIPSQMSTFLMILHSYKIAKIHVKRNDHLKSGRMLIRVANSISKFSKNIESILTATVIECHRAELMNSSFIFSSMLMKPSYRNQIDPSYKKRIESIVKKRDKTEKEEPNTECPFCGFRVPETDLLCSHCKHTIPYWIVTVQY